MTKRAKREVVWMAYIGGFVPWQHVETKDLCRVKINQSGYSPFDSKPRRVILTEYKPRKKAKR